MSIIRVGIIGLHRGGAVHVPAFKANVKYEVTAVASRTPGAAELFAREHLIPRWYTDPRQLILSQYVDLVSIASPPASHARLAAAALVAGKHALVEVPYVACAPDAVVLKDLMKERVRLGGVAFTMRYIPALRYVSDILADGRLGSPRLMRFEFFSPAMRQPDTETWMWDSEQGGGVLAGYMAHILDLALRWFGPVREVAAHLSTLSQPPEALRGRPLADDTGWVNINFENGMQAQLSYSAAVSTQHTRLEIHGDHGSLLIEGLGETMHWVKIDSDLPEVLYPPMPYLEDTRGESSLSGGFAILIEHLAEALRSGKTHPLLPTFRDGLRVARCLDAIYQAAHEKHWVTLG